MRSRQVCYQSYPPLLAAIIVLFCLAACNTAVVSPGPTTEIAKAVLPTFTPANTATPTQPPAPISTAMPTATALPKTTLTITPAPIPAALESLRLAFTNGSTLNVWSKGKITQVVEYIGEPYHQGFDQIINTFPVDFSDDGVYIAFVQLDSGVWTVHPDGTGARNIYSVSDLAEPQFTRPYLIGWLPGTHSLLFSLIHWVATGLYSYDPALYLANVDTGKVIKQEFKGPGGRFCPAPDGKHIAVTRGNTISLIDGNGRNLKEVFQAPDPSFRDYNAWTLGYNPVPVWAPDSQSFVVVIPPENPIDAPDDPAQIWRIFTDQRAPEKLASLPAALQMFVDLGVKAWVSPDLSDIAYLRPVTGVENQFELHLARIDLSEDVILFKGGDARVLWSPDSQHILIWPTEERDNLLLADRNGNIRELSIGSAVDMDWIDPENMVFFNNQGEFWLVTIDDQRILLTTKSFYPPMNYFREFDFIK